MPARRDLSWINRRAGRGGPLRKGRLLSIIRPAQKVGCFFLTARLLYPALDVFVSQPRPLVDRSQASRLLKWQAALAAVLALAALIDSPGAAVSAGLGAGIALAGSVYFVLQAFRDGGARAAPQIVRNFYKGEAGKFVITVLLFAAVFAWAKPQRPGWLLTGFILEQLVVWGFVLRSTTAPKQ